MQPMVNMALRAARQAGEIIARAYKDLDLIMVFTVKRPVIAKVPALVKITYGSSTLSMVPLTLSMAFLTLLSLLPFSTVDALSTPSLLTL